MPPNTLRRLWVTNYTTGDITTTCNPLKMCKVHLDALDQIRRKMAGEWGSELAVRIGLFDSMANPLCKCQKTHGQDGNCRRTVARGESNSEESVGQTLGESKELAGTVNGAGQIGPGLCLPSRDAAVGL